MLAVLRPLVLLLATVGAMGVGAPPRDEDEDDEKQRPHKRMAAPAATPSFDADLVAPEMAVESGVASGATPGGTNDANLLRATVAAGRVPPPGALTPEGLFAEHDLPLRSRTPCDQFLCVSPEVSDAQLEGSPDRHYLAQIGFTSDLDLDSYARPPLHLIVAIDMSTSMRGRPLETTAGAVRAMLGHLDEDDRVSLVAFRERAQVGLQMVRADDRRLALALSSLHGEGRSNLDVGLGTALQVGRRSARSFPGRTRVLLFSDDRPTHGRTGAQALVEQVQRAAADGVGLTSVGVGLSFDAEFARAVGNVRGGSVLFFDDLERMRARFASEFESLFLELAHELELVVEPAPGMRVTEVYGVPPKLWERRGRGIALRVETVFSSRRAGAIYFTLDPEGRPNLPRTPVREGVRLGQVRLTYREVGGARRFHTGELRTVRFEGASPGLSRGSALVDAWIAVDAVARAHAGSGDRVGATRALERVVERMDGADDPGLAETADLLRQLLAIVGG